MTTITLMAETDITVTTMTASDRHDNDDRDGGDRHDNDDLDGGDPLL